MPIWLRRFTYKEISNIIQSQNDATKKATNSKKGNIDLNNPNKANIPKEAFAPPNKKNIQKSKSPSPSYSAKVLKK
tara:strand:- start:1198 stop:1425 length:228 start_codon:yes stop_codon:yes gene_type:complete